MASRTTKFAIVSAAAVLLLAAGAYYAGDYLSDADRMAERFEKAVDQGKPDKLLKLLAAAEGDEPIGRNTADGIVRYLGAHPEAKAAVVGRLGEEAGKLKGDPTLKFSEDEESAFVYLEKKAGKRWFFYDDYELKLKRYEVPVTTTYAGSTIRLNGEEAGYAGRGGSVLKLGPLLPGDYAVKAEFEGKYAKLEQERTLELYPIGGKFDGEFDVPLEGEYVNVSANNRAARVFLNGEDLGFTVEEGQRLGPIAIDGSNKIRVEVDYPWGVSRSEEVPVDRNSLQFELNGLSEEEKSNIADAAYAFVGSWYEAYVGRDAGKLRHVQPGLAKDLSAQYADMFAADEHYVGELMRAEFDLDSVRMDQYSETDYEISLLAKVDYREAYYYGAYDTQRPDPVAGTQYAEYRLQYENGQWVVSGWSNVDEFATSRAKTYE